MRERPPLPNHTVLVRCWLDGHAATDGAPLWRFVVEEVSEKRQRYAFASLDALLVFLQEWLYTATE